MDDAALTKKIFQLNPKEEENQTHDWSQLLDVTVEPFYIDTQKYFLLANSKYYISIQDRFKPVKPHTHATCEINYVYSGEVTQWIDGKVYTFTAGDVVILDKLVPHAIYTTGEKDILINLHMFESFFSGDFIHNFTKESLVASTFFSLLAERNKMNYLIFHTKDNKLIRQTINNMLSEHFEPKVGSSEMIKAFMLIFFGELLRSPEFYVDREFLDYNGEYYIPDILKYIEENYREGSLKKAAEYFSISSIHLTRLLKTYVKKTYKQLVHEKRISVAYNLLLATNLPIYEISEKVGYSNLNTFNQKFREVYGALPGVIRQNEGTEIKLDDSQ